MNEGLDKLNQSLKRGQDLWKDNDGYLKLIEKKDPISHAKFKKALTDVL